MILRNREIGHLVIHEALFYLVGGHLDIDLTSVALSQWNTA